MQPSSNGSKSKFKEWARTAILFVGASIGVVLLLPGAGRDYAYGMLFAKGIYMPDPVYTFAPGQAGEVTNTFRIYNLRSLPLHIKLEPSCGCIRATQAADTIGPYSWTSFQATMSLHGTAREQQQIAVHTDSPARPFLFAFFISR